MLLMLANLFPSTEHEVVVVKMKNRNDAPKRRNAETAAYVFRHNNANNKNTFIFVWYFAHLIVSPDFVEDTIVRKYNQ